MPNKFNEYYSSSYKTRSKNQLYKSTQNIQIPVYTITYQR